MIHQAIILITQIKCAGCFNRIDQIFQNHHARQAKLDASTMKVYFAYDDESLHLSSLLHDLADASYPSYVLQDERIGE